MRKDVFDVEERPRIRVLWKRGLGNIPFKKPLTFLNVGLKDSGKSTLLECCALRYGGEGRIFDLFGSRDNEGLAWGRVISKNEMLFITGDSVQVRGRWNQICVKDVYPALLRKNKVVLSVSAFFGDLDEEFYGLDKFMDVLYKKTHWKVPELILMREASNYIYARIKKGKHQDEAKADFIYLLRESRHMGYAVGVDTIRWTSIDKEVRDVSDITFIKRVGTLGLPHDLKFVYRYIAPPALMNPPPEFFAVVSNRGPIGIGKFDYVEWHKREKDDLINELGLRFERGEVPDYGDKARGWLSDHEHGDIITRRQSGTSMHRIAEEIHRSPYTVNSHIKKHNQAVQSKRGYCIKCRRIKHPFSTLEV